MTAPTLASLAAPQGGAAALGAARRAAGTAPTLASLVEGPLCMAAPLRGREAPLHEVPASPPQGGAAALGAARRAAGTAPTLTLFAAWRHL